MQAVKRGFYLFHQIHIRLMTRFIEFIIFTLLPSRNILNLCHIMTFLDFFGFSDLLDFQKLSWHWRCWMDSPIYLFMNRNVTRTESVRLTPINYWCRDRDITNQFRSSEYHLSTTAVFALLAAWLSLKFWSNQRG